MSTTISRSSTRPASPPAYSIRSSDSSYPVYLPSLFKIGFHRVSPLVTVAEVQDHLRLLGAFYTLQRHVETIAVHERRDPEIAWGIFLSRAVYRFNIWVNTLQTSKQGTIPDVFMPPIDVIMVWHTYMLNPRVYYEDTLRTAPSLQPIPSFPLREVADEIDPGMLIPLKPPPSRVAGWKTRTSLDFELPFSTKQEDLAAVLCPICPGNVATYVPWITATGRGYAQVGFIGRCQSCRGTFTREAMRVRRFCEDAYRVLLDPNHSFLAGTLLDRATGQTNPEGAKGFSERLMEPFVELLQNRNPAQMAEVLKYKMITVWKVMAQSFSKPPPRRMERIIACYDSPYSFSIDLSSAVIRQGSFIKKMVDLKWTEPSFFPGPHSPISPTSIGGAGAGIGGEGEGGENAHVIVRAIARYHAFLDMMSASGKFYVPTLDIDLAWHTHQLKPEAYRTETLRFLKRTPNHDDKVEEGALTDGYDSTARAWKERYGVPYSLCGCGNITKSPPASIGKSIGRALGLSKKSTSNSNAGSSTSVNGGGGGSGSSGKVTMNNRPDLLSVEFSDSAATHPSGHNAVLLVSREIFENIKETRVQEVQQRNSKRRRDVEMFAAKGEYHDDWQRLQVERSLCTEHDRAVDGTTVPYWGVSDTYGTDFGGAMRALCAVGANESRCTAGGCGSACGVVLAIDD